MKEITVEAKVDNLNEITDFVNIFLEENECSMKAQVQIDIAIDEIYSNICYYSYDETEKDPLATVRCDMEDGAAKITFIDHGVPYNPLEKEDPDITLSAQDREIGGLGIFMVKKSMDDVKYEYVNNQNCLTIIKKV